MSRRAIAIVLLLFGFVLLGIVGVVYILQQNQPTNTTSDIPTIDPNATVDPNATPLPIDIGGTPEPLIEVVVSLQTVPRGWQMTETELTTDFRVASEVDPNVIRNLEDVVGLYARTDIYQGQTLTKDVLVGDPTLAGVEDYGPSSLIPEGFIAQAIPMDRLSGVGYGLATGDSVDILIDFYIYQVDEEFQTLLQNSAVFPLSITNADTGETTLTFVIVDPFGRFETLPNGDLTLISPSEDQRPVRVAIILQNAKVIQVGPWSPANVVAVPTETPTPDPAATPTPEGAVVPTPTPLPPDVVLLALSPQQQLVLKYALESLADIDLALRPANDGQIYTVENVDLNYLLQRFNIEVPIDYNFTANPVLVTVTPAATVAPTAVPQG